MIEVHSGKISKVKPINQKKGTIVSIKNLFFSTPARLKFLKTDNYESLLIKRIVQKLALCNYKTDFELNINNKLAIKTRNKDEVSDKQLFENNKRFTWPGIFRKFNLYRGIFR